MLNQELDITPLPSGSFDDTCIPEKACNPTDLKDIFPEIAYRLALYALPIAPGYSELFLVNWLIDIKPELKDAEIAALARRALSLHFSLVSFCLDQFQTTHYSSAKLPAWLYEYAAFAWVEAPDFSFSPSAPKLHFAPSVLPRLFGVISSEDETKFINANRSPQLNKLKVSRPSSSRAFERPLLQSVQAHTAVIERSNQSLPALRGEFHSNNEFTN